MQTLKVTIEALDSTKNTLEQFNAEYLQGYADIQGKVQELGNYYVGEDYNEYLRKINDYQSTINKMKAAIDDFGAHLTRAKEAYLAAQETNKSAATNLPS